MTANSITRLPAVKVWRVPVVELTIAACSVIALVPRDAVGTLTELMPFAGCRTPAVNIEAEARNAVRFVVVPTDTVPACEVTPAKAGLM